MSARTPLRAAAAAAAFGLAVLALFASAPARAQAPEPLENACSETPDNPWLVTSQYVKGADEPDAPAIVAFRNTPNNQGRRPIATQRQVGATFGLAYDPESKVLFAAAFHKRGTAYGPSGPGGIYRIEVETGAVAPWLTVPEVGNDTHDESGNYWPDTSARNQAGVFSLGDIDLDASGETLYVMHLRQRRILRYRVADKQLLGSIAVGSSVAGWASEGRPFGLKVWRGKLYHGIVNSAYRSQRAADLAAYVYESELDGTGMRLVAQAPLDFDRGNAVRQGRGGVPARWQPWKDGYNGIGPSGRPLQTGFSVYPMPMLVDIEFSAAGEMVLGFRDRNGDMTFFDPGGANPPGEGTGIPAGDILVAQPEGDQWRVLTTPEYFDEDAGPGLGATSAVHEETGFGGLVYLAKPDLVVTTGLAPERISSGGAYWFQVAGRSNTAREELYGFNSQLNFGKANGLGDLEALCGPFVPTPTPTASDTPTRTPTRTITPSPTPTLSPTITPTPTPHIIYLPFAEKSKPCVPDAYHTDVVLVLDRSTSMLRSVEPGGMAKNEAAIAAAQSFVGLLDYEPDGQGRQDQVAVVGFNDTAWVESPLSTDPAIAMAALERIRHKTVEGTRLDLALEWGQKPLLGPERRAENRAVVILLTDGLPNRVPFGEGSAYPGSRRQEDSVLQAADRVKAAGTRLYTVALGTPRDILPWLMIATASERDMYYYAPRPEDLAGIYARIAQTFSECGPKPPPSRCVPEELHADVVLVLDMSTSMYRETRGGRTKHAAAVAAARDFVAQLDLERDGWGQQDQVGIVGFNNLAWAGTGLTDDRAAIEGALDGMLGRIAEGTRLDLALIEGQRVLGEGPRLQPNVPVLVLLTDGLPNRVPTPTPGGSQEETVLAAAAAGVKAAGTRLYTIGLGEADDVLRPLMEGVASEPGMYYYAPDGEDLAAIYRQIAGRLAVCPTP